MEGLGKRLVKYLAIIMSNQHTLTVTVSNKSTASTQTVNLFNTSPQFSPEQLKIIEQMTAEHKEWVSEFQLLSDEDQAKVIETLMTKDPEFYLTILDESLRDEYIQKKVLVGSVIEFYGEKIISIFKLKKEMNALLRNMINSYQKIKK